MGQYHDPDTITTVGRKLNAVYPHKFETLASQLMAGEKLSAHRHVQDRAVHPARCRASGV